MSNTIKPVLLVTHERSGSHFMFNSLAVNFNHTIKSFTPIGLPAKTHNYYSLIGGTKDYKEALGLFLKMAAFSPDGSGRKMFKTHHDIAFLEGSRDYLDQYNVIYVERECKDVLTSLYYYFRNSGPNRDFPNMEGLSLRDFVLNTKPGNYQFDIDYSHVESSNFVERWKYHREGWVNSDIPLIKTSYEDLSNSYNDTMSDIADKLGFDAPNTWYRPDVGEFVSVDARKGVVGDWQNLFEGEESLVEEIEAILNDENNTRPK